MRLIDADALIEDLKKWKGLDDKAIDAVLETIKAIVKKAHETLG